MILNNRLGFPVTTGGKKSENDILHFAVNIFLRYWGCFFKDWIIKNLIFTLGNVEMLLFWNERKVIFMQEFVFVEIKPVESFF